MIRRKLIATEELKAGMIIDQSVVDRMGRSIITKGAVLEDYIIGSMIKLGISNVYIQDGVEESVNYETITCDKAKEVIEKLRKEDPAKLTLSDSVKERIATGIQYIYNNTTSSDFTDQTLSITNNLMDAIDSNDAIAIDINSLKTSDEYTFKHSVDVATISMILAKKAGMSHKQIYEIGIAGLLHDIGKTQIPLEILNKPARLTGEEFAIMKQHSVFSYRMIQNNPNFSNEIKLGVLQHHEKTNQKGYPMGCNADQISPYARILAVADIYDALVTERPYKSAFSQRNAVEMIMSMTNELDFKAISNFLNSMILYPVDSIVTLSNGEVARVVINNPHYILRPTVVGLNTGKIYNLGEDISCANLIIV